MFCVKKEKQISISINQSLITDFSELHRELPVTGFEIRFSFESQQHNDMHFESRPASVARF
jgi:hypothetical protein